MRKVGTLKAGATYRVSGQSETPGWWQISFDGKDAWVSADLVDVNGPTETVAVVQVAPPPTAVPVAAKPAPRRRQQPRPRPPEVRRCARPVRLRRADPQL